VTSVKGYLSITAFYPLISFISDRLFVSGASFINGVVVY